LDGKREILEIVEAQRRARRRNIHKFSRRNGSFLARACVTPYDRYLAQRGPTNGSRNFEPLAEAWLLPAVLVRHRSAQAIAQG
jgi:hypothetical protein